MHSRQAIFLQTSFNSKTCIFGKYEIFAEIIEEKACLGWQHCERMKEIPRNRYAGLWNNSPANVL